MATDVIDNSVLALAGEVLRARPRLLLQVLRAGRKRAAAELAGVEREIAAIRGDGTSRRGGGSRDA